MLCNSTSGSHLKLIVQKQLALYPYLTNNLHMTGNSVEKKMFCCVECKIRSKI